MSRVIDFSTILLLLASPHISNIWLQLSSPSLKLSTLQERHCILHIGLLWNYIVRISIHLPFLPSSSMLHNSMYHEQRIPYHHQKLRFPRPIQFLIPNLPVLHKLVCDPGLTKLNLFFSTNTRKNTWGTKGFPVRSSCARFELGIHELWTDIVHQIPGVKRLRQTFAIAARSMMTTRLHVHCSRDPLKPNSSLVDLNYTVCLVQSACTSVMHRGVEIRIPTSHFSPLVQIIFLRKCKHFDLKLMFDIYSELLCTPLAEFRIIRNEMGVYFISSLVLHLMC